MPVLAAAGADAAGVELTGDGAQGGVALGADVGEDRCEGERG